MPPEVLYRRNGFFFPPARVLRRRPPTSRVLGALPMRTTNFKAGLC